MAITITKSQLKTLIESSVKQALREQTEQTAEYKARAFWHYFITFMSTYEYDGLDVARPFQVTRRLSDLKAVDPEIASQIQPLWKEIFQLAKQNTASFKLNPEREPGNEWMEMQSLEREIGKILRRKYPSALKSTSGKL